MTVARRLECIGAGRPCPAHAWWYQEGVGRPRLRCPTCSAEARRISRACPLCGLKRLDDTHRPHECLARIITQLAIRRRPAAPSSEDANAPSPSPSAALSAGRGSDGRSA